jgi:hypothetical protein
MKTMTGSKKMNDDLIHLELDRSFKHSLPAELLDEISKQQLDIDKEKSRISFCGFLLIGRETYVFMPRGSDIDDGSVSKIQLARLLFGCLTKYCRASESFLQKKGRETVVGSPQILPLISEIFRDFRENGFYVSDKHFYRNGFQGKPDWKRTVSKVFPQLLEGDVVYPYAVNRLTDSFHESEVTRIHRAIIFYISEKFGWLFGDKDLIMRDRHLEISDKTTSIGLLKTELRTVFNEAKIHTLKLLIRFLEGDFFSGPKQMLCYGFNDFQYVWEHMLREVLGPTHFFADLPAPAYIDVSGHLVRKDQKGQRADIFLYDEKTKSACVVDAKYYDGSSVDNAPGWPDLVKQFFYAKSLTAGKLKDEIGSVSNYFVFPGDPTSKSPAKAHVLDSSGPLDKEFQPIDCVHIRPEKVIHSYVHRRPLSDLRGELLG